MVYFREVKKLQKIELERLEFKQRLIVLRDPDTLKAGEWERFLEKRKKVQSEFKLDRDPSARKQMSRVKNNLDIMPKKPPRPREPE